MEAISFIQQSYYEKTAVGIDPIILFLYLWRDTEMVFKEDDTLLEV